MAVLIDYKLTFDEHVAIDQHLPFRDNEAIVLRDEVDWSSFNI